MATNVPDDENPLLLKKKVKTQEQIDLEKLYPRSDGSSIPLQKQTMLGTVKRWWNGLRIKPYVKSRDLNNSEDTPYENKPKTAYEIGIQGSF